MDNHPSNEEIDERLATLPNKDLKELAAGKSELTYYRGYKLSARLALEVMQLRSALQLAEGAIKEEPELASHYAKAVAARHESQLGQLAAQFRGCNDRIERQKIADEYCAALIRMMARGQFSGPLSPEDELPDEYMPLAYLNKRS